MFHLDTLSHTRVLPDFLIIGAQKCGTTSLYKYLCNHPNVIAAQGFTGSSKEVRYFSRYYSKGTDWYRRHFPTYVYKYFKKIIHNIEIQTGESTPSYIHFPQVAKRVYETIPEAKFILLLRNPVNRALSHYNHVLRLEKETLTFEDALKEEENRLKGEKEKLLNDPDYVSLEYGYHSYLTRGIYVDEIVEWLKYFSREQILIIQSEKLFEQSSNTFKNILEFLGLPKWEPSEYIQHNAGKYVDMNPETRKWLVEYFRPHNERLFDLIGKRFDWDQ